MKGSFVCHLKGTISSEVTVVPESVPGFARLTFVKISLLELRRNRTVIQRTWHAQKTCSSRIPTTLYIVLYLIMTLFIIITVHPFTASFVRSAVVVAFLLA